jgi:hypothetical protein
LNGSQNATVTAVENLHAVELGPTVVVVVGAAVVVVGAAAVVVGAAVVVVGAAVVVVGAAVVVVVAAVVVVVAGVAVTVKLEASVQKYIVPHPGEKVPTLT